MTAELQWQPLPSLPDPEGFAGAFAGVSGGALIFAGGSNFIGKRPWEGGTKLWYDTVYVLDSPGGRWRVAGRLPKPNAYGVSATFGGELIVAGGGDLRENYRDVFALRWDGRTLHHRTLAPLPVPTALCCGALANGILYVAGGIERPDSGTALRGFWALDLRDPNARWRTLAPIPGLGRMNPDAAAHGDTFYLVSGVAIRPNGAERPARTFLSDAYAYSPAGGWRQLADLPHPVAGALSPLPVTPDGRVLVMSGDDGMRITLDGPDHPGFRRDGLLFDPVTDAWRAVPAGPLSRATVSVTEWHGRWIIPGGERKPGYRTNEVWSLTFAP
jgi:N-acetylneuraminic acid mutarotase